MDSFVILYLNQYEENEETVFVITGSDAANRLLEGQRSNGTDYDTEIIYHY